jgi:hypothetical protein
MVAYTGNNGLVHFTVSDGYDYFARAETFIGSVPAAGSALLVSSPVAGETYNLALNVQDSMPEADFTIVDPPNNEVDSYKITVEFEVPQYAINGTIQYDDITGTAQYSNYVDNGRIDFFVLDSYNSDLFMADVGFNSVYAFPSANSFSYEFEIPDSDNWHFIFSNKSHLVNHQYLEATIKLYQYSNSAEQEDIVATNSLHQNYPNPFNPSTTISFEHNSSKTERVQIEIYNLKGQKVDQLIINNEELRIGEAVWNAEKFSSGIYLYKLIVNGKDLASRKMLLLK